MSDDPPDLLGRVLDADVDEDLLRALGTREQRYTLYYLLDHDRVTLSELADVLAGWLATTESRVTTGADRSSLRIALYHNHLPQLASAGLVDFDATELVVDRSSLSAEEREIVEAAYLSEHWTGEPVTP
ncbi:hypothetical protein SAMN05216559_1026 [Halomicrobium zhouii]|uniref:DUF7344 domain-containing protein n=1 Tax=Halomicrobium zhouii TaxID=767519 RepID=A0A1I6KMF0_9EURY|nr:hypothetical protein [Halomicrobium zhouii]SFR92198.1 hypothetical protein SAMN05216559_1026 [Halomicrobium zhouii]